MKNSTKKDCKRIELNTGIGTQITRKVAFEGNLVATTTEGISCYDAYVTSKGNIIIHIDLGVDGSTYNVYESIDEISSELDKYNEKIYPTCFIHEIAEAIGEEFIEELNI